MSVNLRLCQWTDWWGFLILHPLLWGVHRGVDVHDTLKSGKPIHKKKKNQWLGFSRVLIAIFIKARNFWMSCQHFRKPLLSGDVGRTCFPWDTLAPPLKGHMTSFPCCKLQSHCSQHFPLVWHKSPGHFENVFNSIFFKKNNFHMLVWLQFWILNTYKIFLA